MKTTFLVVLVLLLALVCGDCTVDTSGVDVCNACVAKAGCGWCSATRSCVNGTAAGPSDGNGLCLIGWIFGSLASCPNCELRQSCADCSSNPNCVWCGGTQGGGGGGVCKAVARAGVGGGGGCLQPLPNACRCDRFSHCKTCSEESGCFWCPAKQKCLFYDPQVPVPQDCVYPFTCPACADVQTCQTCLQTAGCAWCGSCKQQGQCANPVLACDAYCRTLGECEPCSFTPGCQWCASPPACQGADMLTLGGCQQPLSACPPPSSFDGGSFVGGMALAVAVGFAAVLGYLAFQCCLELTSCGDCTNVEGCGFCWSSQTCVPGSASGPNNGVCMAYSWFYGGNGTTCPDSPVGGCSTYTTCGSCRRKHEACGWCAVGDGSCVALDKAGGGSSKCGSPGMPGHIKRSCQACQYYNRCLDCQRAVEKCYWCPQEQMCLPQDGGGACKGLATLPGQCRDCTQYTDCMECQRQPDCVFCKTSMSCALQSNCSAAVDTCAAVCATARTCQGCLALYDCTWQGDACLFRPPGAPRRYFCPESHFDGASFGGGFLLAMGAALLAAGIYVAYKRLSRRRSDYLVNE